jgi:hypothetical protein
VRFGQKRGSVGLIAPASDGRYPVASDRVQNRLSITLDRETGVTKPARLRRIEVIAGAERPSFEDGVAILEVAGRDACGRRLWLTSVGMPVTMSISGQQQVNGLP